MLEAIEISKTYTQGGRDIPVLKQACLTVQPGELVGLIGPSGSGKSTLLHLLGLLERPDSGQIRIEGRDIAGLSDRERTRIRRQKLGFVYQFHHLMPEFSALENVLLPAIMDGRPRREAADRAAALLESFGLGARMNHRPATLSGGEQQRTAMARALVNKPAIVLADEPTGNLDPETSETVAGILIAQAREYGLAALIATHSPALAARLDRPLYLERGTIQG